MKIKFFIVPLVAILFISCNRIENEPIHEDNIGDLAKLTNLLHSQNFTAFEKAVLYSETNFKLNPKTKGIQKDISISDEALITLGKMENVQTSKGMTIDNYHQELLNILLSSRLDSNSHEFIALYEAIEATVAIIEYKASFEVATKGFWSDVWDVAKCVGGTIGSAGLGALAGAAVGTITVPVIGTVSGTAVGAVSGALVGAASFC